MDVRLLCVTSGVVIIATWLFLLPRKQPTIKSKTTGKPDEHILYELKDLRLLRVRGVAMRFLKWLVRSSARHILGPKGIRDGGMDLFRTMRISDYPTIMPLPLPTWNPPVPTDKPIEYEKYLKTTRHHKDVFSFLSIAELTTKYRQKKITPCQVATNIIAHIKDSEKQNPKLRAITQYNEDEINKMAKASTLRYAKGKPLSFLDGVPVGVKEEFDVVPYYLWNGTTFWASEPCTKDASVVQRLRDGGAMIIGMTNMHEIGIGVTGNNCNWRHGTPRNPYNTKYYTGGSSSGSAAAVASGLCLIGLGTDGGGSIRMPAAVCGVVGIKASFGRINTAGVVHVCHTVSHAGPVCNNVTDAALVYGFIAGKDKEDIHSMTQPPVSIQGFDSQLGLHEIRLGIDWDFFKHTDEEVFLKCKQTIDQLEQLGFKIVPIQIPELEEIRVAHSITIASEMRTGMIGHFEEHFDELNPDTCVALGMAGQFTAIDYIQSQKQRTRAMLFLEKIFEDVQCIVTPALGTKVPIIPSNAVNYGEADTVLLGRMMRFMALGNLTGIPGMTFPIGYDNNGLPISLQVMSGWWQEDVMLKVAKATEELIDHRKPELYYDILQ